MDDLEYLDPLIERMPSSDLKELQGKRLRQLIAYINDYPSFYRRRFKEDKTATGNIKTLNDIEKLPFKFDIKRARVYK